MTITLPAAIAATEFTLELGGERALVWVCVRERTYTHRDTRCAVVVVTNPVCLLRRRRTLDLFPSHQHLRRGVENNAPKSYQFSQFSLQNFINFVIDALLMIFPYQILKF